MAPYNPPPISSPTPGQNPSPLNASEERNWAMACHLSALLGFVLMPSANIWAPLIIWLWKRNDSAFIDQAGRESVNFHISLWIYSLVAIAMAFTIVLIPLAILLGGALYLAGLVYTIIGAVKTSGGEHYRYPFTLRLIS